MKIGFIKSWRHPAHIGYESGFHIRWGWSACGRSTLWQWSFSVSFKYKFHESCLGFRLYKPAPQE